MTVTIFKNIHDTSAPYYRPIETIIDRIKTGKSKELITFIRTRGDKDSRNNYKKSLPSICFSGRFEARAKDKLIEHSGLICIDFDNYANDDEMNEDYQSIIRDRYTFIGFISPSGDGFKIVVKIPPCTANEHDQYFNALRDYYQNTHFDVAANGVSRVCYESYDPNIYVNKASVLFDEKMPNEGFTVYDKEPQFMITNEAEIIRKVDDFWRSKYKFVEGQRNKDLFMLARYLNEFGVEKTAAMNHVLQYVHGTFTAKEASNCLNSAYKDTTAHKTRFYDDDTMIDKIKAMLKDGKSKREIIDYLKRVTIYPDNIDEVIDGIFSKESDVTFYIKDKTISIVSLKYKQFLKSNGFYKYYPEDGDSYLFVRQIGNVYDPVSSERIKSFVLGYLERNKIYDVYEFMTKRPMYFSDDFLSILDEVQIKFCKDTKDSAFLFYRNKAVEVKRTGIVEHDYIDLGAFVWKSQVVDRDFNYLKGNSDNDYSRFMQNISGINFEKLKSVVGYLLHGYKSKSNTKAVILNDEMISENPEGGTGKGLFMQGISKLKKTVVEDGKKFKIDKSFAFQKLDVDTQILFIDDIAKGFNFESLFSIITEGVEIEKKNQNSIYIPVERSPKIVISTNYPIKGVGHSFDRRKIEIELKQYYSKFMTPEKEFGRALFDEWNEDDYNRFDNFMIGCLHLYMAHGLTEPVAQNGKLRKFLAETSQEFYDFVKDNVRFDNTRYYKSHLREDFKKEYPDFMKMSERRFTQWLKIWYSFNDKEAFESSDMTGRFIMAKITEPTKDDFEIEEPFKP